MSKQFIEFVGRSFLNDAGVVAYQDGKNVKLVAETTRGNPVSYTVTKRNGEKEKITLMPRVVSPDRFRSLKAEWSVGCVGPSDTSIVDRALSYMERCTKGALGIS